MVKNRVVLLGDCAHLVTPNTARGGHTALLDAQALRTSLSAVGTGASVDEALAHYNTGARERARALLEMGRARNARYLPPGGVQAAMRPADLLLRQQQARAGGGGSGARGGEGEGVGAAAGSAAGLKAPRGRL